MNSEKISKLHPDFDGYQAVLLDIAGTTTSLTFIKETLFKFALDQVDAFLKENWEKTEVKDAIKEFQQDPKLDLDGAIAKFKIASDENSSNPGFKTLQGLIYEKGYNDKTLKAHVFADVPKALGVWTKDKTVAIYSTGSIQAQKLLFSNSVEGDLTGNISQYFDQTVIGTKTETESYKKIAQELKVDGDRILFISDDVNELNAAAEAGLQAVLINRTETAVKDAKLFPVITSFDDLLPENCNKRKLDTDVDAKQTPPSKMAKTDDPKDKTDEVAKQENTATETSAANKQDEPVEAMEVDETPVEQETNNTETEPKNKDIPVDGDAKQTEGNDKVVDESDISNSAVIKPVDETNDSTENSIQDSKSETAKTESKTEENLELNSVKTDSDKLENVEKPENVKDENSKMETEDAKLNETEVKNTNGDDSGQRCEKPAEKAVEQTTEKVDKVEKTETVTETLTEADSKSKIEDNAKETESKVENNLKENEGDSKKIDDDLKQVENGSKMVEDNSKEIEVDTKQAETDLKQTEVEKQVKVDPKQTEVDAKQPEIDTKQVEVDTKTKTESKQTDVELKQTDDSKQSTEPEKCTEEEAANDNKKPKESKGNKAEIVKESTSTANGDAASTTESVPVNDTNEVTKNGRVNGNDETEKIETEQEEGTDLKIKKLEANVGSPAVSVEV